EEEGVDWHAGRVLPLLRDAWTLRRGCGEARVRMRGRLVRVGGPFVALPVDRMLGRLAGHPLPPDVPVVGQGTVREDRVLLDRCHRVRIRLVARVRRDAEEAGLGIEG